MVDGELLRAAWDAALAGLDGTFSLALLGPSGLRVSRDADAPHYAASTIKLAVLVALLQERTAGRLPVGSVRVHADFASTAGGSFTLEQSGDQDDDTWARLGGTADLPWLAERMVVASGNLATDLVVEQLGIDTVQRFLADSGLPGLTFNRLIGDAAAEAAGRTNTVTAAGLASLISGLADHSLLGPADGELALNLLAGQQHRRMIPAGLPDGTWSASKGGWVPGVQHDVALVRPASAPPYVLAVCTTSPLPEPDAERLIARLSTITWEHWNRWHG